MVSSFFSMIGLLVRNIWFLIIFIVSLVLTSFVSDGNWGVEGLKMIPASIGVLLGGLLTTISIILAIIRDEDLRKLYEKHGDHFFQSLSRLKFHVLLILTALAFSLLSFFFKTPPFIQVVLDYAQILNIQLFYFIQVFFILITLYSTFEVIHILFLIFEIKFTLVTKK